MAYSYQQILESQYSRLEVEHAEAAAELEAARRVEDAYRTTSAADKILELDKYRDALDRRAQSFIAGQQAHGTGSQPGVQRPHEGVQPADREQPLPRQARGLSARAGRGRVAGGAPGPSSTPGHEPSPAGAGWQRRAGDPASRWPVARLTGR